VGAGAKEPLTAKTDRKKHTPGDPRQNKRRKDPRGWGGEWCVGWVLFVGCWGVVVGGCVWGSRYEGGVEGIAGEEEYLRRGGGGGGGGEGGRGGRGRGGRGRGRVDTGELYSRRWSENRGNRSWNWRDGHGQKDAAKRKRESPENTKKSSSLEIMVQKRFRQNRKPEGQKAKKAREGERSCPL